MAKPLDVICIGRSSVDLDGEQVGGAIDDGEAVRRMAASYLGLIRAWQRVRPQPVATHQATARAVV